MIHTNSYALSQNYGAVDIVVTTYVSAKSRPYFLCANLASPVVAVSKMAPVKTSELLLSKGRAPSQNCADINILSKATVHY